MNIYMIEKVKASFNMLLFFPLLNEKKKKKKKLTAGYKYINALKS